MHQTATADPYAGTIADNYERYFVPAIGAPVAEDLIAAAALKSGESVLDVACGTGVIARIAKERVGSSGSVAGLDAHPGMLATARAQPGGQTIDWYESVMESMPLPDAGFDVVLCQMGLQFVTNKQAATHEMVRVLKPGGRLLISVPGPIPDPFAIMAEALAHYVGEKPAMFAQIVFSLHDAAELRALAVEAGLGAVNVSSDTKALKVPPPSDFFRQYIQSTPLADVINQLDGATVEALTTDVVDKWQQFATADSHMQLDVRMSILSGEKP